MHISCNINNKIPTHFYTVLYTIYALITLHLCAALQRAWTTHVITAALAGMYASLQHEINYIT